MQLSKFIRPAVVAIFVAVIGSMTVMADTTHVVNRGETLQSIAQKYGVTTEQIIQANPQAAQFVYVGMELTIPGQSAQTQPAIPAAQQSTQNEGKTNIATSALQNQATDNDYEYVIRQWGIDYVANFSDDGKGYYGLFCEILGSSGWGAFFSYGASFGITKPGQMHARFGPDYGVRVSESLVWSLPVALNMSTFDFVSETKYNEKTNKTTTTEDMKIAWGLSATPKIALKVEKVYLNLGLDVNYTFERKMTSEAKNLSGVGDVKTEIKIGGKAYVGFFVALGF